MNIRSLLAIVMITRTGNIILKMTAPQLLSVVFGGYFFYVRHFLQCKSYITSFEMCIKCSYFSFYFSAVAGYGFVAAKKKLLKIPYMILR